MDCDNRRRTGRTALQVMACAAGTTRCSAGHPKLKTQNSELGTVTRQRVAEGRGSATPPYNTCRVLR